MGRTFGGRNYGPGSEGGNDVPRGDNREPAGALYQQPNTGQQAPPESTYPGPSAPTSDQGFGDRGGGRQGYDNRGSGAAVRSYGGRANSSFGDRDPNYAFISYLYPTGKNGGFSVFLKKDMLEILKSLEDDDVLGISPSGRDGWMMYGRRVDAQQKEDYRRNGGKGGRGGGGGGYRR